MDEVTQQNAALVEENAATAKTLEQQAQSMDDRMAFFRIGNAAAVAQPQHAEAQAQAKVQPIAGARRAPVAAPRRVAAGRRPATLATAVKEDADWKEF
jgi:hypothetical protein